MTLVAREVLADCWFALSLLEADTESQSWRVHWAAAIALARAVGSVLDKVDSAADPLVKLAQAGRHRRWKNMDLAEHQIFREFIERERNNLLKEYQTDVYGEAEIFLGLGDQAGVVQELGAMVALDENLYRPMEDGPWAGEDARDVLRDALDWWERELTAIDAAVEELRRRQAR